MKKHLPLILVLLFALVGFIDSSLVHLKEIAAHSDPDAFASCSINAQFNCATVASSRYANLLGLPVSQIGMYFYEAAAIIAAVLLLGWKPSRTIVGLLTLAVTGGLLFSFYLLYMSYFGIGSLCIYCLISNVSTLGVVVGWLVFAIPRLRPNSASHA